MIMTVDVKEPETHPVQGSKGYRECRVNTKVSLLAYEVYKHIFSEQAALITGDCRGGFSSGELICFLYARSFPKAEWRQRFHEAIDGMKGL